MDIDNVIKLSNKKTEKDIKAMSYIEKKTQKIITVVLMLADVLDRDELIKHELQKTSIRLLKEVSNSANSSFLRKKAILTFTELSMILKMCSDVGYLSKMNIDIILNEIDLLLTFFNKIDWANGRRFFDETVFVDAVPDDLFNEDASVTRTKIFNRQETDRFYDNFKTAKQHTSFNVEDIKKDTVNKGHIKYKERIQEIQKDRRATILGLLQKKDRITVKDVANIIKDCSNKTIQRELLALVKQGVLKKEGERRWSTYRLA